MKMCKIVDSNNNEVRTNKNNETSFCSSNDLERAFEILSECVDEIYDPYGEFSSDEPADILLKAVKLIKSQQELICSLSEQIEIYQDYHGEIDCSDFDDDYDD